MLTVKRLINIWHKLSIVFMILIIFENIFKIRIEWIMCLVDNSNCNKDDKFIDMFNVNYVEIPVLLLIFYMIGVIKSTCYFVLPYCTSVIITSFIDEIVKY